LKSAARLLGLGSERNGSVALVDLFQSARPAPPPSAPPHLAPEEPLPGVVPQEGTLVFVHGNYWKDALGTGGYEPEERAFLLRPLRNDPRYQELRRRYQIYYYYYPTQDTCETMGRALSQQLAAILPPADGRRDVTIVAHSLGGLVARYALQDGLGERTRTLLTLATPHHGTMLVSILLAPRIVRARIGLFGLFCQRVCRRVWPVSHGIACMASDDWDGRIGEQGRKAHGLYVNESLAELNRTDRYLDRVIAVMGRVRGPWLSGRNFFDQVPRWVMGRMDAIYRGLDPLVHLESGLAEGLSVRLRHTLDDLDHEGIVTQLPARDLVFATLLPGSIEQAPSTTRRVRIAVVPA
jgi:pimeloyl-ACP methyl ester carboxylesterase